MAKKGVKVTPRSTVRVVNEGGNLGYVNARVYSDAGKPLDWEAVIDDAFNPSLEKQQLCREALSIRLKAMSWRKGKR